MNKDKRIAELEEFLDYCDKVGVVDATECLNLEKWIKKLKTKDNVVTLKQTTPASIHSEKDAYKDVKKLIDKCNHEVFADGFSVQPHEMFEALVFTVKELTHIKSISVEEIANIMKANQIFLVENTDGNWIVENDYKQVSQAIHDLINKGDK
jgi:hypothetical protein